MRRELAYLRGIEAAVMLGESREEAVDQWCEMAEDYRVDNWPTKAQWCDAIAKALEAKL